MSASTHIRTVVHWLWLPVVIAFGYSGWVLYSRHAENRELEDRAVRKEAEADRQVVERLGGGNLKVLTFYANPPVLRRGEQGQLCFGVANAKTVRMEPAVEGVRPSLSRCVDVRPVQTTNYKLIATDGKGGEVTQDAVIRVR